MAVYEVSWSSPLTIQLRTGDPRTFSSTTEALMFLEHEWPTIGGQHYQWALLTCRHAEERRTSATVCREKFLKACMEAGLVPPLETGPTGDAGERG